MKELIKHFNKFNKRSFKENQDFGIIDEMIEYDLLITYDFIKI